jgi:hypothetical protein
MSYITAIGMSLALLLVPARAGRQVDTTPPRVRILSVTRHDPQVEVRVRLADDQAVVRAALRVQIYGRFPSQDVASIEGSQLEEVTLTWTMTGDRPDPADVRLTVFAWDEAGNRGNAYTFLAPPR